MPTAPTLNGQVIGMTHYATRALLQRVLDTVAMTFEQSVVLGLVATGEAPLDRDEVVRRATSGLKVSEDIVLETLDQLAVQGCVSSAVQVALTDRGRDRMELIRTKTDLITEALYGDLPAEDLAVAGRILTTVRERANSMLGS